METALTVSYYGKARSRSRPRRTIPVRVSGLVFFTKYTKYSRTANDSKYFARCTLSDFKFKGYQRTISRYRHSDMTVNQVYSFYIYVYLSILSRCAMSSINPQVSTSHKCTPICQHVHRRSLEVLRCSQTAKQSTAHPDLFDFGLLLQQLVCHGSADVLFLLAIYPILEGFDNLPRLKVC